MIIYDNDMIYDNDIMTNNINKAYSCMSIIAYLRVVQVMKVWTFGPTCIYMYNVYVKCTYIHVYAILRIQKSVDLFIFGYYGSLNYYCM